MHSWTRKGICIPLIAILSSAASAEPGPSPAGDLTELTLEDLMNVVVTSVSKKAQSLSKTPAAAFILTHDDIRRSGMTNIPDLLRLVPGVDVMRISSNTWAISIRGFNERYSTKVLVLVDGRSVYSAEFSGVYWDQISVPLEDIDRIEVVRGPGGTVWGANAVNGVINIITEHSEQTQGGLVSAGSGSVDSANTHVRYGGTIGNLGTYRAYGRYYNAEDSIFGDGTRAFDGLTGRQVGFRADLNLSPQDTLTVEGDLHSNNGGQTISTLLSKEGFQFRTFNDVVESTTRNLLGRWSHVRKNGSETTLQMYFTDAHRADPGYDEYETADAELQHHFALGKRHDIVAGAGYRHHIVKWKLRYNSYYDEDYLTSHLANTFLQDEIALTENWSLTLGSKFEHNSFTGFEYEPSAQLLWSPSDERAAWISVARAIRQPSFFAFHAIIDGAMFPLEGGQNGLFTLSGNPHAKTERLLNFEAGYRTRLGAKLNLDLTAFRSQYRGLTTNESEDPYFSVVPIPALVFNSYNANLAGANNYGAEGALAWQATDALRLTGSYSYLQMKVRAYPNSTDASVPLLNGSSPKHQWQLHSSWRLRGNLEWDAALYRVGDAKSNWMGALHTTPGWVRVDTRLGWHWNESTEISVNGQNLLSPGRLEYPLEFQTRPTQVQRAVFGKLVWTF